MPAATAPPPLAPPVSGRVTSLDDARAGRLAVFDEAPIAPSAAAPLLLVHSVNAAATAFEIRPLFERYGKTRPTYALDLPGFGLSDRSDRAYTPRLMTDALHAVTAEIRRRHAGAAIDALAVSLSCEFLARAASEDTASYRSLALVSPTGMSGTRPNLGPPGSTRAIPGMHGLLSFPLWSGALFGLLTRPGVVRYFLERTWGGKAIDEALWAYDVETARQPGAKNAPLYFLSGHLFSRDTTRLYDSLAMPVWMSHGVRGDFVDYRGAARFSSRGNWRTTVYQTGALPYFEVPAPFFADFDAFLEGAPSPTAAS